MSAADGYRAVIHCPLCDGPLHMNALSQFECQTGHLATPGEVADHSELRLGRAMWMAIEALDTEALCLRVVDGHRAEEFAQEAEEQARLLREFGHRNFERRHRGEGSDLN